MHGLLLMPQMTISTYRFKFGGSNGSVYHTNSLYDIKVLKKGKDSVVDKSGHIKAI